ncbi:MAG: D-tyrosyl-tRNA(Tyr) deacylase [Ignavibacteria bacterium]|jgi:D-tyrosyl-tRNA(Tyr) deacylase|nr:D-tyrosyl-tRNA(Tyr) deacylase [Ignavibacteria bacterium]MBK9227640.1 D-tyrosyl-tRNA(Tyr) deacylase [Ignavibacteria bacterium]
MIAVIQRVRSAEVRIDGNVHCNIGKGLLILLGIKKSDSEQNAELLAEKISLLRIFSDEEGKMNLSVRDVDGEVLVVSQFTLCTDNGKSGNRPSFTSAEVPERAIPLYEFFVQHLRKDLPPHRVKTGVFAAMMEVELVNDGPVTIILEK